MRKIEDDGARVLAKIVNPTLNIRHNNFRIHPIQLWSNTKLVVYQISTLDNSNSFFWIEKRVKLGNPRKCCSFKKDNSMPLIHKHSSKLMPNSWRLMPCSMSYKNNISHGIFKCIDSFSMVVFSICAFSFNSFRNTPNASTNDWS